MSRSPSTTEAELTQHWLIAITLRLAHNWSWGSLAPTSFQVHNSSNQLVGTIDLTGSVSSTRSAPTPTRSGTNLIFFDAVDQAAQRPVPRRAEPQLHGDTGVRPSPPAKLDPPLQLQLLLPIAARRACRPPSSPRQASRFHQYAEDVDYFLDVTTPSVPCGSSSPSGSPTRTTFFGRVLAYAPDQMLTGAPLGRAERHRPATRAPAADRPRADQNDRPRPVPTTTPGLNAMQPLIPSSSPFHFAAPPPPGRDAELGVCVSWLRHRHTLCRTGRPGRSGPPLRVAGVQHPAPPLLCEVNSQPTTVTVSAPYATPVFTGRNLLPAVPRSRLWALLYTQVTQADGASQRNVLLDRIRLTPDGLHELQLIAGIVGATWSRAPIEELLASLALPRPRRSA